MIRQVSAKHVKFGEVCLIYATLVLFGDDHRSTEWKSNIGKTYQRSMHFIRNLCMCLLGFAPKASPVLAERSSVETTGTWRWRWRNVGKTTLPIYSNLNVPGGTRILSLSLARGTLFQLELPVQTETTGTWRWRWRNVGKTT